MAGNNKVFFSLLRQKFALGTSELWLVFLRQRLLVALQLKINSLNSHFQIQMQHSIKESQNFVFLSLKLAPNFSSFD